MPIWALKSTKSIRLREIRRVTVMGEIEKKVKTSRSLGQYLAEGNQRGWFVDSSPNQYGEGWMGAVAGMDYGKQNILVNESEDLPAATLIITHIDRTLPSFILTARWCDFTHERKKWQRDS